MTQAVLVSIGISNEPIKTFERSVLEVIVNISHDISSQCYNTKMKHFKMDIDYNFQEKLQYKNH